MSLRAKLSHVNNGVGVERGVRKQQLLGDGSGQKDMSYQKWFSRSMLDCIYLT